MNCPKCGTYNPEDRTHCWRCETELPKPKPVKKKNPQKRAQVMLYVLLAIFVIFSLLQMMGFNLPFGFGVPSQVEPSGHLLPQQGDAIAMGVCSALEALALT